MKPAEIHPHALTELLRALQWYNGQQPGLGAELKVEVLRSLDRIESDPGIGSRYRNTGYQFVKTERFPYVIYYLELPKSLFIAAIAHSRRRPDYWQAEAAKVKIAPAGYQHFP